ncbi:FkbM family methyltransferase [Bradyrhizobium sp. WSM471]|uniref:FkbM family methyltransferase n=1 Tax=Bradyrhizobium sp. WSM471 TaxID=319017 RepID=UPI00024D21BD|nr:MULTISPECIES: FkbM family methyltransferase [Bradyrhizobium]EHR01332.1 methyltransferase, FkbM family [Bradyrhizobium sp. WSM471]UFW43392.1 FkbM family methyltransferase [Bradyrhizobium canariense]
MQNATTTEHQRVVEFVYDDKLVRFFIEEPRDVVQKAQLHKSFYEQNILERLKYSIPEGAIIADIGANVGNHTVYFGLFCRPAKVYVFEPNTHLQSILKKNIELNHLTSVDQSYLRFGISGSDFEAKIRVSSSENWGNGHLVSVNSAGSAEVFSENVSVRALDSFEIKELDFIKADVEGHELALLEGAQETLKRCQPAIFIEVGQKRIEQVTFLLESLGYRLIDFVTMYRGQGNYLFVPTRSPNSS